MGAEMEQIMAMIEKIGGNGAARENRTLDLSLTKGVLRHYLIDKYRATDSDVSGLFCIGSRQSWANVGAFPSPTRRAA